MERNVRTQCFGIFTSLQCGWFSLRFKGYEARRKEEYRDWINLAYRKKAERNEEIKHNKGSERKSRDQAGKEGRGSTGEMKHERKDKEVQER
jgi:hypothetical protein